MPDRLSELLQQRRLIEEHLAWLNREIGAATPSPASSGLVPPPATPHGAPLVAPDTPASVAARSAERASTSSDSPAASSETGVKDADAILAEYQMDPQSMRVDVKRGCLLYFSVAMGVLILGVSLLCINYWRRQNSAPTPPTAHPVPRH